MGGIRGMVTFEDKDRGTMEFREMLQIRDILRQAVLHKDKYTDMKTVNKTFSRGGSRVNFTTLFDKQ